MRVGLLYKTVRSPYGGVNTFFNNFEKSIEVSNEVAMVQNFRDADIILTVGHRCGPDRELKKFCLKNVSWGRAMFNPLGLVSGRGIKKIVFRLDGLKRIYTLQSNKADEILIDNLEIADSAVFQSRFSKECFDHLRITYPESNHIILNGANTDIFYPAWEFPDFRQGTLLISNSWSTNLKKGFEVIARFSELEGVTVLHIGRWPERISTKAVKLLGLMGENQVAQILRKGHFFLFPSEDEACPNTVVEALASGIPVLYDDSGGTPELCRHGLFGMPIPASPNTQSLKSFMQEALEKHLQMRNSILEYLYTFSFSYCFNQYIQHFKRVLS